MSISQSSCPKHEPKTLRLNSFHYAKFDSRQHLPTSEGLMQSLNSWHLWYQKNRTLTDEIKFHSLIHLHSRYNSETIMSF